jgi:predicted HicB family RNase H-like nuclease
MTREEYIGLRQQNNVAILMEYYLEKCKEKDVKPLILNIQELLTFLNIWLVQQGNSVNDFFARALNYYDNKFTITKIINEKQELIGIQ